MEVLTISGFKINEYVQLKVNKLWCTALSKKVTINVENFAIVAAKTLLILCFLFYIVL